MRSYPVRLVQVLKVNLHIPPYFVFADSGGSVKSMQMRWLVQTLPLRPCAKAYFKISAYFWAFNKGLGQPAAHMRSLAKAFAQRVNVSATNILNGCVKLSWCLMCQCKQ